MLRVEHITSLNLPQLAPYRTMRRQQGLLVVVGAKVARRVLCRGRRREGAKLC